MRHYLFLILLLLTGSSLSAQTIRPIKVVAEVDGQLKYKTDLFGAYKPVSSTYAGGTAGQANQRIDSLKTVVATNAANITNLTSGTATQATRDNGQDSQIAGKLPNSFSTTQAATDAGQNTNITINSAAITATAIRTGTQTASRITAKINGTAATKLRYLIFGDSYASRLADYIYPQLRITMGGTVGGLSFGSTGDGTGVISSSGSVTTVTDYSVWPVLLYQIGAGAVATFGIGGVNATWNKATVYYIKDGGGTFKPQIAGADVAGSTSLTTTGTGDLGIASFTATSAQQGFSIVNLTGTVRLVGVALENTTGTGMFVWNCNLGGMELSSWVNVGGSKALSNLALLVADQQPDLFTLEMKEPYTTAYDGAGGITRTLLSTIRTAAPAVDMVLVCSTPAVAGQDDADTGAKGFSASLRAAAPFVGAQVFDTYAFYQSYSSPYAKLVAENAQGDGIHRASWLSQYFAGLLMRDLGLDSYLSGSGMYAKFAGNILVGQQLDVSADYASPNLSLIADVTFKQDGYIRSKRWLRYMSGASEIMRLDLTNSGNGFFPNNYPFGSGNARIYGQSGGLISSINGGGASGDFAVRNITRNVGAITTNSATLTLDFSTNSRYTVTLTQNITSIVVTNPPGNSEGLSIRFLQDVTGGRTVLGWPTGFRFEGGATPAITTTSSKSDIYRFFYDNTTGSYFQDGKPSISL